MRAVRIVLALALILVLAASGQAAPNKAKKGKKGSRSIHGVVVAVQKDKDKDSGTITVQVKASKKNAANQVPVDQTFQVTPATRFEIVSGKKGQTANVPATFAAVHKGERVVIQHNESQAVNVKITKRGKKKA